MSTQYIASASVYTGAWINWTDGLIKGSTLTVSSRDGGFLIAFLAWFVGIAGNTFWDVLSSVIFLYRATESPKDALFHQQQMSLRVGVSSVGTLWRFWKLGRQWHHRAKSSWLRSWPIIFTAFFWIISFSAAGILVSKVTETRSDVILIPMICGLWDDPFTLDNLPDLGETVEWQSHLQQLLNLAGNYVSACYEFNTSRNAQQTCLAYGRSTLAWSVEDNVQCPFAPEMCSQGKSILLDSGLIDSHSQLGINSRAKDRVQYRQQLHCSPLETEGHVFRTSNISDPRLPANGFAIVDTEHPTLFAPSGTEFVGFQYGTTWPTGLVNESVGNVTYVYNNYTFGLPGADVVPSTYLFDTEFYDLSPEAEFTFFPIPQINQTDADLTIVFLINQARYEDPVEDPWFQALVPNTEWDESTLKGNLTYYTSALPASAMGCISRYQWCKDDGKICTGMTGQEVGGRNAAKKSITQQLRLNPRQQAIFSRLYNATWNTVLFDIGQEVTSDILLADQQVALTTIPGLPENQWMLEVNHWFGLALTALQLQIVEYVLGDGRRSHNKYMKQVDGDSEWMCHNQIVQRDDFTSFSSLGIVLILLLGGSFLIIDLCLEPLIVFWYRKIQPSKAWKLRAWRGNRFLQIQSQALEAKGLGTWERTKGDIPVTKHHEIFVSPFSVSISEDRQTRSEINTCRWWQQKSCTQITDGIDAQSVTTDTSLTSRELLPPIEKSTLRPFEVELGKLSIHPRPGYDRLYSGDTEVMP